MGLHTGRTRYICENCGEKFYTPNGIKGHKCEKQRRRPEQDYRINDLRHCRFCDSRFENFDQNKAHTCSALIVDDPRYVVCRCCSKKVLKAAFNRHMETHTGIDWVCNVCNKHLATQRALKGRLMTDFNSCLTILHSFSSHDNPYRTKTLQVQTMFR